jgi:hypothetical protein
VVTNQSGASSETRSVSEGVPRSRFGFLKMRLTTATRPPGSPPAPRSRSR